MHMCVLVCVRVCVRVCVTGGRLHIRPNLRARLRQGTRSRLPLEETSVGGSEFITIKTRSLFIPR